MKADPASDQAMDGATHDQPREFLPLRSLANTLTVLLISTIALTAGRLAVPVFSRGDTAWQAGIDAKPLVLLSRIAAVATAIVFLIWFRRARINAEGHRWHQRFARGWTLWGWFVPIVTLWFPLQIMDDI